MGRRLGPAFDWMLNGQAVLTTVHGRESLVVDHLALWQQRMMANRPATVGAALDWMLTALQMPGLW